MVKAVFDNLGNSKSNHFTIGIKEDVTNSSLGLIRCQQAKETLRGKFYGLVMEPLVR
jgi:hypothetical protein